MQPIRLSIAGNFWDSHIYRGRLYLWGFDNSIGVYNWDSLIDELGLEQFPDNRLILQCAYTDSALLYDPRAHGLLSDPDVKRLLQEKFVSVASAPIVIGKKMLSRHEMARRDNFVPELHDDSEIYSSRLYLLTGRGLFSTYVHKSGQGPIGVRLKKHWDGAGTYLRAKSKRMAIAALSDGLFQLPLDKPSYEGPVDEPENVTQRYVSFVNWSFSSLYCSSEKGSFLVGYTWETVKNRPGEFDEWGMSAGTHPERRFAGIVDEKEVFAKRGQLSWGYQEKMYSVRAHAIDVVRFRQSALKADQGSEVQKPFSSLGEIPAEKKLSKPIRTSTATFGVIVETDSGLLVCQSDNSWTDLPGVATRWRVFPRSYRYENQLHVTYEDRLEILSFPGDFFVDQGSKLAGTKFEREGTSSTRFVT